MAVLNKQDRSGVRTASDLERKYDLQAIAGIKVAIENSEENINKTNKILEDFVVATLGTLENMQSQIDGNITTWFYSGVPSLNDYPASEWETEEIKANHMGDLYYDQETGYAYRFAFSDGEYRWIKIVDNDVVEALALANAAQDTADSKRRVFTAQPVPPYDSGDLWFKDSEIYICQISKEATEVYAEKDFIIATKYTDDTYAKQVGNELTVVKGTVTTIQEGMDNYKVEISTKVTTLDEELEVAKTSIEANTEAIDLRVRKDSVISAINVSTEGVKISGNKINIEGAVTFSALASDVSSAITKADNNASTALSTANNALDSTKSTNKATDSPILLTDSTEGKVIDFKAYGRSTQDGEPTPDNPIEIESVGDSGWFDGELLQGFYDGTTGKYKTANSWICSANPTPCTSGDIVRIKYSEIAKSMTVAYYDENMEYIAYKGSTNISSLSVTMPSNAKYYHININATGITPQTAKHICVTINDKYALIVKSKGKNLLKNTITTQTVGGLTFTLNDDDSWSVSGTITGANNLFINRNVKLKAGTYILSGMADIVTTATEMRLCVYDGKTVYANLYKGNDNATFTLSKDTEVIVFISFSTVGAAVTGTAYPMIRPVGTDTTYEPYKEDVKYIPTSEPLRSMGEVRDVLNLTNSEIKRNFAEVVFDGSSDESWGISNSKFVYIRIPNGGINTKNVLSTHYKNDGTLSTTNHGNVWINNESQLIIVDNRFATLDEWKAWLSSNPITVIYELAEPTVELIEPVDILTYNSTTYITASDDADMEVEYYRNTNTGQQLGNISIDTSVALSTANEANTTIASWCFNNDKTIIDGGKLATGSVTAEKINVTELFSHDIYATGTIHGVHVEGGGINLEDDGDITNASMRIYSSGNLAKYGSNMLHMLIDSIGDDNTVYNKTMQLSPNRLAFGRYPVASLDVSDGIELIYNSGTWGDGLHNVLMLHNSVGVNGGIMAMTFPDNVSEQPTIRVTDKGYNSYVDITASGITPHGAGFSILASSIKTSSGADLDTINNNLKGLFYRTSSTGSGTIGAGGYGSIYVPLPSISDYSTLCPIGFALNSLYVQVYNYYQDLGNARLVIGVKNTSSSSITVNAIAYFLMVKTSAGVV